MPRTEPMRLPEQGQVYRSRKGARLVKAELVTDAPPPIMAIVLVRNVKNGHSSTMKLVSFWSTYEELPSNERPLPDGEPRTLAEGLGCLAKLAKLERELAAVNRKLNLIMADLGLKAGFEVTEETSDDHDSA